MLNLKDCREAHYTHSASVSSNVRTLAMSGIAIIWLFSIPINESENKIIPEILGYSLLFVVITLALDFIQYAYLSVVWHCIFRRLEKKGVSEKNYKITINPKVNGVAYFFFYLKILTLIISYATIGHFIINYII